MNINIKQEELIKELFQKVNEKYPELEFLGVKESPGDRELLWIRVFSDLSEEREIEMRHYASELETDILVDYGYSFGIMPEHQRAVAA